MKRTLSLVLALVMVLGSFGTVFAAHEDTADVVEAGAFLETVGVLEGDDDGNLMLDKTLLRRDMVVLLSRLMGVEQVAADFPSEGVLTFEDITDPYYNGYIAWSVSNELIEGHSSTVFGFNENVTAQQYVTVLMRALGYRVDDMAYVTILDTAEDLGLCEGLDLENDDQILRGQMAVLTLNALGTEMKDSEETLAEKLGIELPEAPEAKELKVEKVRSENLKEVVVELSNAKLADSDRLEEANNYRVDGKIADRVTVMDNDVIIELETALRDGKEYDLKIRNIGNDVDGTYSFTARDNTAPSVEEVEALGEYGIKVMMSEPVRRVNERDFLIDGRNETMKVETYGRIVILTPYRGTFPSNAKTLTVKSLEDYAGFRSTEEEFAIDIEKDEIAPQVTDVVVRGDVIEVTFDKDIYKESVKGYKNRSEMGNIFFTEGRRDFYADAANDKAVKTDYNKAEYKFDREIPRNARVTIEGVQNHSKVAMERTTEDVREVLDYREPEIIETDIEAVLNKTAKTADVEIELTFNKNVKNFEGKDVRDADFDDHFSVFKYGEVLDRNEVRNLTNKSVKYDVDNGDEVKDVVIVKFTINNIDDRDFNNKGELVETDYVLEVKNFEDASSRRNRMFRDYIDFEVEEDDKKFVVEKISIANASRRDDVEVTLTFNKAVDKKSGTTPENYVFTEKGANPKKKDVEQLDGEIITTDGDKKVILILPEMDRDKLLKDYETLTVYGGIKDRDDNRLGADVVYNLKEEATPTDIIKANDVINDIEALPAASAITLSNRAAVLAARAAYDDLTSAQKALVTNKAKLEAAEAKIAELEKEEEDQDAADDVYAVIDNLPEVGTIDVADKPLVNAARTVYNGLTSAQKLLVKNVDKLEALENKIAVLEAEETLEEANAFNQLDKENNTEAEAKAAVLAQAKALTGLDSELEVTVTNFTAPTSSNTGSITFTVKITVEDQDTTTNPITVVIEALD